MSNFVLYESSSCVLGKFVKKRITHHWLMDTSKIAAIVCLAYFSWVMLITHKVNCSDVRLFYVILDSVMCEYPADDNDNIIRANLIIDSLKKINLSRINEHGYDFPSDTNGMCSILLNKLIRECPNIFA